MFVIYKLFLYLQKGRRNNIMMNYIWVGLVVIAVIAGGVTGTMEDVLNNVFNFANEAVNICLGLIGIMAFFCGLMKVMEKAGICDLIAKALAPIMTRLFPDVPKTIRQCQPWYCGWRPTCWESETLLLLLDSRLCRICRL